MRRSLSVLELRQLMQKALLADYTAGGDFHPAPKTYDQYAFQKKYTRIIEEMQGFLLRNLNKCVMMLERQWFAMKGRCAMMIARPVSCCFSGHRPNKLPWGTWENDPRCLVLKRRIHDAVSSAIAQGYTHFICGMAQGCDLYFAEEILYQKTLHGEITLEAAIPCLTQTESWPQEDRKRYEHILALADLESVVQRRYSSTCMQRRNRYMVDHASMLIAVYGGVGGGTRNTVLYAMERGLDIIDIPLEE